MFDAVDGRGATEEARSTMALGMVKTSVADREKDKQPASTLSAMFIATRGHGLFTAHTLDATELSVYPWLSAACSCECQKHGRGSRGEVGGVLRGGCKSSKSANILQRPWRLRTRCSTYLRISEGSDHAVASMPGLVSSSPPRTLSPGRLRSGGQRKLVCTSMGMPPQEVLTLMCAITLRMSLGRYRTGRVTAGRG
jgi:hypothetical protein